MSSQLIESHKQNAKFHTDPSLCKIKSQELLQKMNLPKGFLPLDEFLEVGYDESPGFVWVKTENKKEDKFSGIGRIVSYDMEITEFVEDRQMKSVKNKELLIWVVVFDIQIRDPTSGKIMFGNPTRLYPTFPISAFGIEEEENKNE